MSLFGPIIDRLRRATARDLSGGELLARFVSTRDEAAISELIARATPRVRDRCRGYLRDPHDQDEAVQEVFQLLVERADTIRDSQAVFTWLDQTAINVARNRARRTARGIAQPMPPEELACVATDPGLSPDDMAELREKYAQVLAEIELLHEDWRRAFTLRLLEDRPYPEVASLLGASLDKVRQDVSRARKELRARLLRKGIVLPATLATALLGRPAWSRALERWWIGLSALGVTGIAVAAVVWAMRPGEPAAKAPPPTTPPMPPAVVVPDPGDRVLEQVLPLLSKIAGGQARRSDTIRHDDRLVHWRFVWDPDPARGPDAKFRFDPWISRESHTDLRFDRWSGELRASLASDGATAEHVDLSLPIRMRLWGQELAILIPELEAIHDAFEPLLIVEPPLEPAGGEVICEAVPVNTFPGGRDVVHRPAVRHGLVITLEPGETLAVKCHAGRGSPQAQLLVWGSGRIAALQGLQPKDELWHHANDTGRPRLMFLAAISVVRGFWTTVQMQKNRDAEGIWRLAFDEEYREKFDSFSADVKVVPPSPKK